MIVSANVSREVYDYFKGYDINNVVNTLLEMYDITHLPPITGEREKELRVNVENEMYLSLYKTLGPRSKMVSIGRLLSFAYEMRVLSLPHFQILPEVKKDNPVPRLLNKAYLALLEAGRYDESNALSSITNLVYQYKKGIEHDN